MGKYNESIVDKWLEDDNLMLIECWARDGMTESDIANRIGIGTSTLSLWKRQYEEIRNALKKGKEIVDYKVENALLKSALGYKVRKNKVIMELNGMGQMVTTRREISDEEVPPNVNAISMWLINRNSNKWKRNRDNILQLDDKESNITVNIIRKGKDEDEQKNVDSDLDEWNVVPNESGKENNKNIDDANMYSELTDDEKEWLNE